MIYRRQSGDFDSMLAPNPRRAEEWNVPLNWWHASAYAHPEDWSVDDWHWQFLRRDDDYRRAFDEAAADRGVSADCSRGADDSFDGPGRFSEVEREALIRAGLTYWPFEVIDALNFTLGQFFDPRISDWLGHGPQWSGLRVLPEFQPAPSDGVNTTMAFDLTRPLEPQLKEAKSILQTDQTEAIKLLREIGVADKDLPSKAPPVRSDVWTTYLRALDAKNVGASHATVGKILEPNLDAHKAKAKAGNLVAQARRARHGILAPPKRSKPIRE